MITDVQAVPEVCTKNETACDTKKHTISNLPIFQKHLYKIIECEARSRKH